MLIALSSNEIYEGSELMARFKNIQPIADDFIPVYVEKEYPSYFVCKVLPHKKKNGIDSGTYRLTMKKWDVDHRIVMCTHNYS